MPVTWMTACGILVRREVSAVRNADRRPIACTTSGFSASISRASDHAVVACRVGERGMGFGARISAKSDEDKDALRAMVRTEDLIKYGMIPEFLGRLPIIVSCDSLDEKALAEVLWKPKNALTKQYQRLFEMEGVQLRFTEDATIAVAREAYRRKSGARGLRAIMEEIMLDVMYEIPSTTGVRECVINADVVINRQRPLLIREKKAS